VQNGGFLPPHDNYMLAPNGINRAMELFPYQNFAAWSYMFLHAFLPNLEIWQYLVYLPAFLAVLAAIPTYFIVKTLYDRKAAVLAAFFIVFDISNVSRSLAGDPDTDAMVILMPLIVMAFFLYTYKYIDGKKSFDIKALLFIMLTGILLGLWTFTWIGYWYITWLITGFFVIKFLLNFVKFRKIKDAWQPIKYPVFSYMIMLVIFMLMVIPFYGTSRVLYTVTGPFEFSAIKTEENIKFPNVYVSVAELQESGGIKDIIQRTSVIDFNTNPLAIFISPFFFIIYALIYLTYSYYKKGQHIDTVILLLIWFIGPFIATIVAVRFSLLFSAPMAIGSGILLSKAWNMITKGEKIEE
jgi:asparagine N-glycosylation enzyme membrane subunit Stt3